MAGTPIKKLQETSALEDSMDIIVESSAPKTMRTKLGAIANWISSRLGIGRLITNISIDGKTLTYTRANGATGTQTTQDTNTTYTVATEEKDGLMSADDKKSLDSLSSQIVAETVTMAVVDSFCYASKNGYRLISAHLVCQNAESYIEWVNYRGVYDGNEQYTLWLTGAPDGQYVFQLTWLKF